MASTYAFIHARPFRVTGYQYSGWRAAGDGDASARELPFEFSVTDDGGGNFLLVYQSVDGSLYGDTWHETLEDAYVSAERQFRISRDEWSAAKLRGK